MPVIRIAEEVYAVLQRHGRAFEDTPNDVLRRLASQDLHVAYAGFLVWGPEDR
jgi:hypothetical protein